MMETCDSREKVLDDPSTSRPRTRLMMDDYLGEATQVPTLRLGMASNK